MLQSATIPCVQVQFHIVRDLFETFLEIGQLRLMGLLVFKGDLRTRCPLGTDKDCEDSGTEDIFFSIAWRRLRMVSRRRCARRFGCSSFLGSSSSMTSVSGASAPGLVSSVMLRIVSSISFSMAARI